MGTWSITPDTGLASIDQNGLLTYQQHTSDVTYTISYSDDEGCSTSKNVTIKKCVPTCDCSRLTVLGKLNISKDGGDNITIGTLSKASCMSNPRASSSESWLSNITVSGNDIKATVALNSGDSRIGSVTVTVDKDGGGTCDRTMSIMQQAGEAPCPYPDDTITIRMYRATLPHYQSYFVLTDAPITEDANEWIRNSGYHYKSPTDIFEDIIVGEYNYEECNVSTFSTDCKYCSIKTGTYSNKFLQVGVKYYCYYPINDQWVSHHFFTMPSAEYCQEHTNPTTKICDVIWGE